MFGVIDSKSSKYRKVINENLGCYNLNTFYTFDHVFSIISKYLKYKTECFLGRPLEAIEFPDRDAGHQLSTESDKKRLEKNLMPRAVMRYEYNPNEEDLIEIPSLKTHFIMNNGVGIELEAIRRSKLDSRINREFDFFRDIDVTVRGNISFTSALIYFTVLLDNKIESIELSKLLKSNFPINVVHDVYRHIVRTDDTTGKTDNTGKITRELDLIPHTLKTLIPNDIIKKLKEVFEISDHKDSDNILEDLMKLYSFNGIGREIDGSTRESVWFTRYQCVPILIPTSIDRSDNVKDMSSTSAVRIEFQLNYIEVTAFKLTSKLNILSAENENNLLVNSTSDNSKVVPLNIISRPDIIENCVEHFHLELVYDDSDMNEDGHMQLSLIDFVHDRDLYFGKYMEWINSRNNDDDGNYYKVLLKHGSNQTQMPMPSDNSEGTYYSYDDYQIYDEISKIDERIFIIVYVDMNLYRKWKVDMGFVEEENLSGKYMRR